MRYAIKILSSSTKIGFKGFTFIELLIVIGILGLLSIVASQLLFHGFKTYVAFRTTTETGEQAQRAMSRMTRELGAAQSITVAGVNQIQFTDNAGNSVQYDVTGNFLMRNANPLADHVSALTLTYVDANLVNTAVLSNIYSIRVSIDFSDSGNTWHVDSVIHPRNLG